MLGKQARLRAEEVKEVLAKGRSVRSTYLQIKHLPSQGALRCAAVAPKSLAKGAVERNRLRRALYRALSQSDRQGLQGMAVCFIRATPKGALTPVFSEELYNLLSKLK